MTFLIDLVFGIYGDVVEISDLAGATEIDPQIAHSVRQDLHHVCTRGVRISTRCALAR
jgi:hypothetical protein